MERDHKAVNEKALALVKKLGVTPEDNDTSKALSKQAADKRAELAKLSGKAFDKAYIDNEVAYHKAVDSVLESTLIPDASNAELKDLLTTGLKIFKATSSTPNTSPRNSNEAARRDSSKMPSDARRAHSRCYDGCGARRHHSSEDGKARLCAGGISAHVGDTIEWVNSDFVAHTATARDGSWDVLIPVNAKKTVVLKTEGTVEYYCKFHPNMTGRILVSK
jgi:plastocyanin